MNLHGSELNLFGSGLIVLIGGLVMCVIAIKKKDSCFFISSVLFGLSGFCVAWINWKRMKPPRD